MPSPIVLKKNPFRIFASVSKLASCWQQHEQFAILQIGFGTGLLFLETCAYWQRDPLACTRLHFVALDARPLDQHALYEHHRHACLDPILQPLAQQLCEQWPLQLPGYHRIAFASGRITLTLISGELIKTLPTVTMRANAIYLDETTHPEVLHSPPNLRSFSRLAAQDATLFARLTDKKLSHALLDSIATQLHGCGFELLSPPSPQTKDTYLAARFAPRFKVRRQEPPTPFIKFHPTIVREAIVIGAGIAGCAVVERLTARGWKVTLIEQHATVAQEGSGNPAGVFHPMITSDDSLSARLSRDGFLYALRYWNMLQQHGYPLRWRPQGLFIAAQSKNDYVAMRNTVQQFALPKLYVELLGPEQAEQRTGIRYPYGGWLFTQGGWIDPGTLCAAQLTASNQRLVSCFSKFVQRLERREHSWRVLDTQGVSIASAPVVILANAIDAQRLLGLNYLPLSLVRGQITYLRDCSKIAQPRPQVPIAGEGYFVNLENGLLMTGATYDTEDTDCNLRQESQQQNIERLERLIPGLNLTAWQTNEANPLAGRVGFRCTTPDRLPVIGAIADETIALAQTSLLNGAHLHDLPRQAGLYAAFAYGSRGFIWSALGAELLASQLDGEPWPMERQLANAIDPARFLLRALRQSSR